MITEKFKQIKEVFCAFAKYYMANVVKKTGSDDADVVRASTGV